jgi:Ser/Thr protein kinase RdoA (MazF antagonist)
VIAPLAARYGIEVVAVAGAAEHDVLHAHTSRGELAVKSFGPGEIDGAAREAALLAHLAAGPVRYRVPSVIRALDGAPSATHSGGALVVMTWCPGVKRPYTDISGPEWFALGNELAALHARLDTFTGDLPRAPRPDLDAEHGALVASRASARAKDPARGEMIARYLDARLALLDTRGHAALRIPPGPELPIHNDYNQHNYLFDGTLPPVILDWEGAIAGTREYEVVRCLNHLPLVAPAHAAAFMAGYREGRPLDPEGLRWAINRSLLEHALKSWPLDRWLADVPGADAALTSSMEIIHALSTDTARLAAFFDVEVG